MAGFLGSGDLRGDRFSSAGAATGFVDWGNATKFAIQEEAEIKTRKSTGKTTYGNTLDTATIKQPAKIMITLDDLNHTNLAIAFLGTSATYTQSASSIAVQTLTTASVLDRWSFLDTEFKNFTAGTVDVYDDAIKTTTYAEGTDYEWDYALGMLRPLTGGAITVDTVVYVDGDYGALAGHTIAGGVQPAIDVAFVLDGKNQVNGDNVDVRVVKATVAPTSEVDFFAEDFNTLELEGELQLPTGYTEAYTVQLSS